MVVNVENLLLISTTGNMSVITLFLNLIDYDYHTVLSGDSKLLFHK